MQQDPVKRPSWRSAPWVDPALHAGAGAVLGLLAGLTAALPWTTILGLGLFGFLREIGQHRSLWIGAHSILEAVAWPAGGAAFAFLGWWLRERRASAGRQ